MRVVKVDLDGTERLDPEPIEPWQPERDELAHPLVLVIWRDAYFDFELADIEDARPDYLVHTAGFLLSEGPRFLSLAQEILPDDDGYRAVTHIPIALDRADDPPRSRARRGVDSPGRAGTAGAPGPGRRDARWRRPTTLVRTPRPSATA